MQELFIHQTRAAVEHPIRGKVEILDLNQGTLALNGLQQTSAAALPADAVNRMAEVAYVMLTKTIDRCQAAIQELQGQDEFIVDDLYGYLFISAVATNNVAVYHFLYSDEDKTVSIKRAQALLQSCIQTTKAFSRAIGIFPVNVQIEVFELAEGAIGNLQAVLRAQGMSDEAEQFEPQAAQASSFANKLRAAHLHR